MDKSDGFQGHKNIRLKVMHDECCMHIACTQLRQKCNAFVHDTELSKTPYRAYSSFDNYVYSHNFEEKQNKKVENAWGFDVVSVGLCSSLAYDFIVFPCCFTSYPFKCDIWNLLDFYMLLLQLVL